MTVLGARPFRSVLLESRSGAAMVVKRFHHPNPIAACLDGRRARREFEALSAVERAGLPVPHPLAVRPIEAGWELCLAAIPRARPLQESLHGRASPPGGWERLAARLGELLARLQLAGWEHGDLHPGNVLVDADGRAWLTDFQRARRVEPSTARRLDEVVECAAMARERLPSHVRARFLLAWLRALPAELRPELAGNALARAIEERARLRRLERVRIGLGRWLRSSSRVRRVMRAGRAAWLRRDLPEEALERVTGEHWLVLHGDPDEVRARWLGAARLAEHGLSVARPAAFAPGSRWRGRGAWAAFEPPREPARHGAELLEALEDRRLALLRPRFGSTRGGVYLLPPREPQDLAEA